MSSQERKKALTLTKKLNIPKTMPRVVATQIHRSNSPGESVSDYNKRNITTPTIRSSHVWIILKN